MDDLTEFQQRAAAAGVVKLLQGDTFYTSTLRQLAETLGRELGGKDWQAMQPLHCVKWGDMDPTLRRMMKEKCLEMLGLPPTVVETESEPVSEPRREPTKVARLSFWRR